MNSTPKLEVPLVIPLQEDGYSCVPRCVKMIFMYICNCLEGKAPSLDIDEIGDIIETAQDGTFPEKVMNLNNHKDVLRTIPSLEFEVELRSHSLSEIKKEIAEGHRPTIAWVELSDDRHTRRAAHAVVITGFEDEKQLIYYNDPMFGEKEEDMASFVTRWENADRVLIKVKIGMKEQRILDEYVEKEANSNQVIEGKILECN